jgi:hypothetical protein
MNEHDEAVESALRAALHDAADQIEVAPGNLVNDGLQPVRRSRARLVALGVGALTLVVVLIAAVVAINHDPTVKIHAGSASPSRSTGVPPTQIAPSGTPPTTTVLPPPTSAQSNAPPTNAPPSPTDAPPADGTTIADAFAAPPAYPGQPWTLHSSPVPPSEIVAAAGPAHCGWDSATLLTIGWPLGTRPDNAGGARQYIRDPNNVTQSHSLRNTLDLHASLPPDAYDTGYRYGTIALYLSPSDQDTAAYLVAGNEVERWPRSDPMTLCS